MTKPAKHIGKQMMVLALIAAIFNIYMLEIWCGLTMNHGPEKAGVEQLASKHASAGMENCPHQGKENSSENSCEDHHHFFITTAAGHGFQKFLVQAGDFNFTRPDHFILAAARPFSQVTLPVKLFPDDGLKPKVPDVRIFICSLII